MQMHAHARIHLQACMFGHACVYRDSIANFSPEPQTIHPQTLSPKPLNP